MEAFGSTLKKTNKKEDWVQSLMDLPYYGEEPVLQKEHPSPLDLSQHLYW